MSTRSIWAYVMVLLLLCLASPAAAQLAVAEAGLALERITWTSAQATITALQSIQLVADSALNLTGFGDSASGSLYEDLGELSGIVQETQALLWDIQFLQQQAQVLFGLDTAPETTAALQYRLFQIRAYQQQRYFAALRLQTLMKTAIRVVERVKRILGRIGDIIGNKQGQQQSADALVQISATAEKHAVAAAAFQNVMVSGEMERTLIQESAQRITDKLFQDWPGLQQ